MRLASLLLLLPLLLASPLLAGEDEAPMAFAFDGRNVELADLLAKAEAEKKLVFLDFYLPG